MGLMKIGDKYYVSFKWKGNRVRTVTPARNESEAKKIETAVKTAFKIGTFGHLNPTEQEVVVRTFENNGWVMPPELARPEPEEELTLIIAVKEYLQADAKHRAERNLYAIDRLVEHFGEKFPLRDMKVGQIRKYQRTRQQKVANATVNRELAVLSGICRVQIEDERMEYNPCLMAKRLPSNQRDTYLSWEDFNRVLEHSWWLHDILVLLYYTGMRFGEAVALRWEMYKPERRMLVLPPEATKEGKNPKKLRLKSKRIPLRHECVSLLESLRKPKDGNLVHATGLIFRYTGRFKDQRGQAITHSMIRKAWARAVKCSGIAGLQMRDLRHAFKTNAQRSGMDPTVRDLIVGHSTERSVSDRYIRVSDEELLKAVDNMRFDNGWTELDWIDEAYASGPRGKGAKKVPKGEPKRKIRMQCSTPTF